MKPTESGARVVNLEEAARADIMQTARALESADCTLQSVADAIAAHEGVLVLLRRLQANKIANDPWIALAKNGDGDRLLDAKEAAEKLGLKVPTVAEMLRRGQLQKVMVGRYVRVRASDLEKFIAKGGH